MLLYWGPEWKLVKLTTSERGRINKALKELREIQATPEQLSEKYRAYQKKWPNIGKPSLTALVGNWNRLGEIKAASSHAMHDMWQAPDWMK